MLARRSPQATSLSDLRLQLERDIYFAATTEISSVPPEEVQLMDVSPKQIVSVATALIPFLEHDDANRALMGANMQKQAVPLVQAEAPYIGTGVEATRGTRRGRHDPRRGRRHDPRGRRRPHRRRVQVRAARSTNACSSSSGRTRTRASTRSRSSREGDRVKKGDVLADGPSTDNGELALGKNLLVAFMPWEGYNFEDAIILSERLVQRRRAHVDPHPRARDRRPRHEARPRRDHAGHPEPVRGDPEGPRRARHHPRRRRGRPRRRARRQGHAEGRDRAHARGAPAARDLR